MASLAERLAALPKAERDAIIDGLTPAQRLDLLYDWRGFNARPEQIAPDGDWRTWMVLAGRGYGKTEVGAQWVRERVTAGARQIALIAETQKDLEEVMVPRLIGVHPPGQQPRVTFRPVRMVWPNGARALGYVGNEPDQLRGPEPDTAWVDELAKYARAQEVWDMLTFALRGKAIKPRVVVTTTPRPIPLIKRLATDPSVAVTRGNTFDNRANLPTEFLDEVRRKYAGTRLGRQELNAEILDDLPGALWVRGYFDPPEGSTARGRIAWNSVPNLDRVVVAVDPSGTKGEEDAGDSIGIVIAGIDAHGHGYVIADRTIKAGPAEWGRAVVRAYRQFRADAIVGEANFGGAMVEHVIRSVDASVPYRAVHASRGKTVRAEPVAALYEQGRVSHVFGADAENPDGLAALEDQLCLMGPRGYAGEGSPDRADALVWALTELMLTEQSLYTLEHI